MQPLTINEMKEKQLKMLIEFDKICKTHNLKYSLCGGTLLGAVRHGGYIPWDDDIDVMMPRPDFEKIMKIKMKNNYYFQDPMVQEEDIPYIYSYGKMFDRNIKLIEFPNSKNIESYLYIDIFPIDGIPVNEKTHLKLYNKVHRLVLLNRMFEISFYNQKDKTKSWTKKKFWNFIWKIRNILPSKFIMKKINKIVHKRNFYYGEKVGSLVAGYGAQENFMKSDFDLTEMNFEGISFKVIKGYDNYLRALYKNYMELPPKEKRIAAHDCIAYDVLKD